MTYTSAEAAKLLRKLKEDHDSISRTESISWEYVAAVTEVPDEVAPHYSFAETQKKLADIEAKIRKIKHAVNVFNTTHTVPGFDMTIDEMLVYIPQLTAQKSKYSRMKNNLPKTRVNALASRNGLIEYKYANYSISDAETEYTRVSDELAKAQTALDTINNTETMEIDI